MEGEQLLWSGNPQTGSRSNASPGHVFSILGRVYLIIGLCLALLGFILNIVIFHVFYFGPLLALLIVGGIFTILGIIFLGVGLLVHFPTKNVFYAITDRRAMIVQGGQPKRVTSYSKRAITHIQRLERPDGSGDLIFTGNGAVSNGYGNANAGISSALRQGVFVSIPNVRQVEQKLMKLLDEN
jgi:hypothetical protein